MMASSMPIPFLLPINQPAFRLLLRLWWHSHSEGPDPEGFGSLPGWAGSLVRPVSLLDLSPSPVAIGCPRGGVLHAR